MSGNGGPGERRTIPEKRGGCGRGRRRIPGRHGARRAEERGAEGRRNGGAAGSGKAAGNRRIRRKMSCVDMTSRLGIGRRNKAYCVGNRHDMSYQAPYVGCVAAQNRAAGGAAVDRDVRRRVGYCCGKQTQNVRYRHDVSCRHGSERQQAHPVGVTGRVRQACGGTWRVIVEKQTQHVCYGRITSFFVTGSMSTGSVCFRQDMSMGV